MERMNEIIVGAAVMHTVKEARKYGVGIVLWMTATPTETTRFYTILWSDGVERKHSSYFLKRIA